MGVSPHVLKCFCSTFASIMCRRVNVTSVRMTFISFPPSVCRPSRNYPLNL